MNSILYFDILRNGEDIPIKDTMIKNIELRFTDDEY